MATYIILSQFTGQGIHNVQDTIKRSDATKELAKKLGVKFIDNFWTMGRYDTVSLVEAPDDETVAALALGVAKLGNVRTETLRAFSQTEIDQILKRVV
ncbi:MAG: GYD domain-containing protein [Methyloceanibacter sp.]|uniref:GYD domain-containing protein n=1 Tax=Methyloceanibacter sp. TaxID=1965321 RepID=UPI003D6D0FFB